jgi:hypothetical protein
MVIPSAAPGSRSIPVDPPAAPAQHDSAQEDPQADLYPPSPASRRYLKPNLTPSPMHPIAAGTDIDACVQHPGE